MGILDHGVADGRPTAASDANIRACSPESSRLVDASVPARYSAPLNTSMSHSSLAIVLSFSLSLIVVRAGGSLIEPVAAIFLPPSG